MINFGHSILIRAAPEVLFSLTQDYGRRLQWDPFLKGAYLLDGATEAAVGIRANCVARSGLAMVTEYVSYHPPNVAAVKMTKGPWFIRTFSGSWRFEECPEGNTLVVFRYHFEARPRLLRPILDSVLGAFFSRDTRKRLVALKRAIEEQGILQSSSAAVSRDAAGLRPR